MASCATMSETLLRYFEALRARDWDALRACVADDVHRTGPYADVVEGREAYVEFLAGVLPQLENYRLLVHQIERTADGAAWVRLSEILDVEGHPTEHPEALRFAFDTEGRISEVDIYLKRPPRPAER